MSQADTMHCFSKKQIHQTMSIVMVALYAIVTLGIDLFHNEDCQLTAQKRDPVSTIAACKEPCPACTFLAQSNSTQVHYGCTLVSIQSLSIFCRPPVSRLVGAHECTGSTILLRGPPFTTTTC